MSGRHDQQSALRKSESPTRRIAETKDDFIAFSLGDAPDRSALRALLESHADCECMTRVRREAVVALALVSIPLWFLLAFPEHLVGAIREVVLIAWGVVFVCAMIAGAAEWCVRRDRKQRLIQWSDLSRLDR